MIAYYFEENTDVIEEAFAQAGLSLGDAARKAYVDRIADHLAVEHNTPFKEFLELVTCADIEEALACELKPEEFADEAIAQRASRAAGSYVASLLNKNHIH